jgi:hypothetical protein
LDEILISFNKAKRKVPSIGEGALETKLEGKGEVFSIRPSLLTRFGIARGNSRDRTCSIVFDEHSTANTKDKMQNFCDMDLH